MELKFYLEYTLLELEELLIKNGIEILPIRFANLKELIQLPFIHKEPFDRLFLKLR